MKNSDLVVVTGRLVNEGVSCQALRSQAGELYTLIGTLKGFVNGDQVVVKGHYVENSKCMQGITLRVDYIEKDG